MQARKLRDRLDVKSCLMSYQDIERAWSGVGISTILLSDLAEEKQFEAEDIVETQDSDEVVTYLRVQYDGIADQGDEIEASNTQYTTLKKVRTGDIVISNIAASHGSVAIVPQWLDGSVVTSEYTVLSALEGVNPVIVWMLLRSPEARAEMLLMATGISRSRVKWSELQDIRLPCPDDDTVRAVVNYIEQANSAEQLASQCRTRAKERLEQALSLGGERAEQVLRAFKPPK